MPSSRSLRCAIAQMNSRLDATDVNLAEACRLSEAAARDGARLILLPEGCLTGNALSSPARQATLPVEPTPLAPLRRVADRDGIVICAGFATPFGDKFDLIHAIVLPGGPVRFQRKAFRASTEPTFLAPWPDPAREVFEVQGVRVVIAICSEFGAPGVKEAIAAAAPDLILHPSAGHLKPEQVCRDETDPGTEARWAAFDADCRSLVERAARGVQAAGTPRMGANPIGFDGDTWWPGNSYAVDASGAIRIWLPGENRPSKMAASHGVADMPILARYGARVTVTGEQLRANTTVPPSASLPIGIETAPSVCP